MKKVCCKWPLSANLGHRAGSELPVAAGRLGASRQQTEEGTGDTASSLGLMVIGSISMHFHAGLCHKFTPLQIGLFPAGNTVGEQGRMGEGGGAPRPWSQACLYTLTVPPAQSWVLWSHKSSPTPGWGGPKINHRERGNHGTAPT